MKRWRNYLLCVLTLISFGCKKSDTGDGSTFRCPLTPTSILGTYKWTQYTIQETETSPVVDDFATWNPCEKDDLITLNADGTYTRVDVGVACSTPGDVITGTWSLNGTTFVNDGEAGTIVSYDCKTFVATGNDYPKETGALTRQ